MFKGLAIGLLLMALSGCGTLDNKTILLNAGDSKERVLEVMGAPADRQMAGAQEAWQYCVSGATFGSNDHKIIWLQSGRVTGISSYKSYSTGCTGFMRQINWQSAPDSVIEIRQR
jgi:hypothetical protein